MQTKPARDAGRVSALPERRDKTPQGTGVVLNTEDTCRCQLKKILAPIDFSHGSRVALESAIQFARQFKAELLLVHVVATNCPVDPYGVNLPDYFQPDLVFQARKQLDHIVEEAAPEGIHFKTLVHQAQSWPADDILKDADEFGADLIVLSTHGRTGLRHAVFGSTAEYIVRHAHCPVLTVRCPEPET